MSRTPQDIYASNLLRRQPSIGYPLRNPRPPESKSGPDEVDREGLQIGDVGCVDEYGRFNLVFNICRPPEELQSFPPMDDPVGQRELVAGTVVMAGVNRRNPNNSSNDYEFTTTRPEGAILILPDGAVRYELRDKQKLKQIREHIEKYAPDWCRFSKQDSLYLITSVFKSKSWALGSFSDYDSSYGKEIVVKCNQSCNGSGGDCTGNPTYKWGYAISVDHPESPQDNDYVNQTVFVKGFKVTMKWDLFAIVERAERAEWWILCFFSSLWSTILRRWLTRITVNDVPGLNFTQPCHPSDIINRVLLEKNPRANVAISHDNDWIMMLKGGLLPEYLVQEDEIREFVVREHAWNLDTRHNAVYLRNNLDDTTGERQDYSLSRGDKARLAITYMRLEGVDIDHIYAGVCVLVQFGSTTTKTQNKSCAGVVEWDDEVSLYSDLPVSMTVCGVFQLGSTLGMRKIFPEQTINTKDVSSDTHVVRLVIGESESRSSLLVAFGCHFSGFATLFHEEKSDFVEKTKSGFEALYAYHDNHEEECLKYCLEHFRYALEQSGPDPACRATALFNLATSKFISCQRYGTYSELSDPIGLYEEARMLRGAGHPDQPAIVLLLCQALLSRLGQEYNESIVVQIQQLLAEIGLDKSREHQTADVIVHTCAFYQAIDAGHLTQLDNLFEGLNCGAYMPPYGYFDRPRMLYKLAVAFLDRFQTDANLEDLDKSIALSKEALYLIPDGHEDQRSVLDCLGRSFLRFIETNGDLVDINVSAGIVELGGGVVWSLERAGMLSDKETLCEQIALVLAADLSIQYIEQAPSPRISVLQIIVDEWRKEGGIAAACKRQLGELRSFLEGEGERKMRERLAGLDWPFKAFKTKETTQVLQNHVAYFQDYFETQLGIKWESSAELICDIGDAAMATFRILKFDICRAICDALEGDSRLMEAVACFIRMKNDSLDIGLHEGHVQWEADFQCRCREKLEELSDIEMESKKYNEAVGYLSTMLLLDPEYRADILIKRGKAQVLVELWTDALSDADEAIKLDPLSHRAYEIRHVALRGAGRHAESVEAFDEMLSKLQGSPDVDISKLRHQYVNARRTIRHVVEDTIRPMPQVLINTITGHLYRRQQQAEAFEALPACSELVSSMTIKLDQARIREAVKEFYRYVMLAYAWEHSAPLVQMPEKTSIYDLEPNPANINLQKFCKLARSLGFHWAWSDNTCVDKSNNVILHESLVARFAWYRASSLTIVYLGGISSEPSAVSKLQGSIWNACLWTYPAYVAARVVLFFTADWKPYLDAALSNHKGLPEILSDVRRSTGVSAQVMLALRPGLDRVREKLCLASIRKTPVVEDAAHSLFGIFDVAVPVKYGEGNRTVGRFLDRLLTGSGDITILAWTGTSGDYNSCLPTDLTVYNSHVPPHIPQPIERAEMETIVTELRSSLPDISVVMMLYKRLSELPPPSFAATLLRLSGITSSFLNITHTSEARSETGDHWQVYRASTSTFGDIEFKTTEDLTGMENLCLVHPWINSLLNQDYSDDVVTLDETTRALRVIAQLRHPFGALLFAPISKRTYRRIAADGLIMAQICLEVSLDSLMDKICTVEVQ